MSPKPRWPRPKANCKPRASPYRGSTAPRKAALALPTAVGRYPGGSGTAPASYDQANTSDIAVAQANVASKQADNERAQADLARMKPLVDKAEISRCNTILRRLLQSGGE